MLPPSANASSATPHVQRVPVRLGVDRHAGHAGVPAGPGDANGDLATVGDEHLSHVSGPFRVTAVRARVAPDQDPRPPRAVQR